MALDWLPCYPDRVGEDTDLPATYGPYYAAAGLPGWRNWTPIVPEWIARRRIYPVGGLTDVPLPRPTVGLETFPVVTYPDRLDRIRDLREYRFWIPFQPTIPSTLKDWAAIYPDRPVRQKVNPWGHPWSFVTVTGAFALPAPMVWQGTYPAQTDRKTFPVAQQQAFALDASRAFEVTSTGWTVVYPDRIPAKLAVPAQQTSAQNLDPIVNPPPTNSTWPPTYPFMVWPKAGLGAGSQRGFVSTIEPIPNAAAPAQSWQQSIPTPPLRTLGVGSSVTRGVPLLPLIIVPAAAWTGYAPTALVHPTVRPSAGVNGFQMAWIEAVAFFAWRGTYPTQLFYPAGPKWLGGTGFLLDPTNLLDLATCVEWTSETFGRPLLTSEAFDRPRIPGIPDVGYLLLEDGGFLLLEDGGKIELELGAGAETFARARMIEEEWC